MTFCFVLGQAKNHHSDLVIEDSHEGETVLGDGRSGVINTEPEEDQLPTRGVMSRPRSAAKSRPLGLGMSGPITNTEVKFLHILNRVVYLNKMSLIPSTSVVIRLLDIRRIFN